MSDFSHSIEFGEYEIPFDTVNQQWKPLNRKGGMGSVFKARHRRSAKTVVLKLITEHLRGDKNSEIRFQREIRSLQILKHAGIPSIIDVGEIDGEQYYAMEFVEGSDLQDRGKLDQIQAVAAFRDLAMTLGAVHNAQLIHRDIKPSNIILTKQYSQGDSDRAPCAKLVDFGLIKGLPVNLGLSTTGNTAGFSAFFASPEQFRLEPASEKSDVYSLGAALWFGLTGNPPFEGTSLRELGRKHHSERPNIAQLKAASIDDRLQDLILSMLEKLEANRPEAHHVASELSGMLISTYWFPMYVDG